MKKMSRSVAKRTAMQKRGMSKPTPTKPMSGGIAGASVRRAAGAARKGARGIAKRLSPRY